MKKRLFLTSVGLVAYALISAGPVFAQTSTAKDAPPRAMVVQAVQMPAWTVHDGKRLPLAPGATVGTAHELETAAGAALVLRMPEGSLIRLGEKTRLGVQRLEVSTEDGRTAVKSELKVFEGFFRFATNSISKVVGRRQIDVALKTATIGIRGTDFWSMTDAEHDATCLFEGRVELATRDQGNLVLDAPTAFWARYFDKPVQPVGNATPEQLNKFLASTELSPGKGVAVEGGRWRVVALTTTKPAQASQLAGSLQQAGYPAVVVTRNGEQQVRINSLATQQDALAVLEKIATVGGVKGRVALGA